MPLFLHSSNTAGTQRSEVALPAPFRILLLRYRSGTDPLIIGIYDFFKVGIGKRSSELSSDGGNCGQ